MKNIQKIICTLTAAAMVFALGACSGTTTTTSTVEKTIDASNTASETVSQEKESSEYINTTLNARVIEVSDGKITVEAMGNAGDDMTPPAGGQNPQGGDNQQTGSSDTNGEKADDNSTQPPEMPDGEGNGPQGMMQGNGEEPPEKPDGDDSQPPEMMNGNGGGQPPEGFGGNGGQMQGDGEQPPEKPDGEGDGSQGMMQGNGEEPPEKPDGENGQSSDSSVNGGEQPPEMPEGGEGQMPEGEGNGQQLTFEVDNTLIDGISAGDFVVITFGDDGNITSVEKKEMMMGQGGGMPGGGQQGGPNSGSTEGTSSNTIDEDQEISNTTYSSDTEDDNAVSVTNGAQAVLTSVTVSKTGDSSNTESSDFYGINAAVFANDSAKVTISDSEITSDAKGGNGVFAYGEGSEIQISDSTISTEKNNSGGIMVSGGGTLTADNLTVTTQGGSSAAIRSDRGGGTITVNGGSYTSNGSGSPAIYSTADITVNDAVLYSDVSQAVVVEGKNSVTLNNVEATGNNTVQNSDNSTVLQAVMIYQSMSGDAAEGKGTFTMNGGSLTSLNEGMFFVTNTTADITLKDVELTYATDDLLRIEAAGWGNNGSNGGYVNFYAGNQKLKGIVSVDSISKLNLYMEDGSEFEGQVASEGEVYVELSGGSTWKLTGNSSVTSLKCDAGSIDLNGYTLMVNGVEYTEGSESTGSAVAFS